MVTERHNVARKLIMKVIGKVSLAGCLVCIDAGSADRLVQQNLQIPENADKKDHPVGNFQLDIQLEFTGLFTCQRQTGLPPVALMPFDYFLPTYP